MLNHFLRLSRPKKRVVSLVADATFLVFALWAAFSLRLETFFMPDDWRYGALFGLTVLLTLGIFVKLGLYRAVVRYISERALYTIITGTVVSATVLIIMGYMLQVMVPRSVPVLFWAMAFIFVAGSRFGIRAIVTHRNTLKKTRVLIVGAGETGLQLATALKQSIDYHPVAFLSLEKAKHRSNIGGLPVYSLNHAERAMRKYGAERVLLALDEETPAKRRYILDKLESLPMAVQTVPSMNELVSGRARINDIRDLDEEDLLGRESVQPDTVLVEDSLEGKAVMVTGAGGSIGSELCRQILRYRPRVLVLFEQCEYSLYIVEKELDAINEADGLGVEIQPLLGNVVHRRRCEMVMRSFGIEMVYHAAAFKHVPLVEHNVIEGVQNNVFGTWHTAEAAIAAGVERFVLISTDKAVRPTNVMGASKRLAELVLQGLAERQRTTRFAMVRFGNVLSSSGSVVPLFRNQIRDGGPVTVTHPDIIRYFMTIPEASQLVLQAGAMMEGGEVFVLDMGEPVRIADLARKMIHLMGLTEKTEDKPNGDIEVVYTGLRPGEKLYEELLIGDDPRGTQHSRIMMAREVFMTWPDMEITLQKLQSASRAFDCERVVDLLQEAPTGYNPNSEIADLVWQSGGNVEETAQKVVRIFE